MSGRQPSSRITQSTADIELVNDMKKIENLLIDKKIVNNNDIDQELYKKEIYDILIKYNEINTLLGQKYGTIKRTVDTFYKYKGINIPAVAPPPAAAPGNGASSYTAVAAQNGNKARTAAEELDYARIEDDNSARYVAPAAPTAAASTAVAAAPTIVRVPYDHFINSPDINKSCFTTNIYGKMFSMPLTVNRGNKTQVFFNPIDGINYDKDCILKNQKEFKHLYYIQSLLNTNEDEDDVRERVKTELIKALQDIYNAAIQKDMITYNLLIHKYMYLKNCNKLSSPSQPVEPTETINGTNISIFGDRSEESKKRVTCLRYRDTHKDFKLAWNYIIDNTDLTIQDAYNVGTKKFLNDTNTYINPNNATVEAKQALPKTELEAFKRYYWDHVITETKNNINFIGKGDVDIINMINEIRPNFQHYEIIAGEYSDDGKTTSYLFNAVTPSEQAAGAILEQIFTKEYIMLENVGAKGLTIPEKNKKCIAKIFDDNVNITNDLIDKLNTHYGVTKEQNDLSYIDNIFVKNKKLYMTIGNKQYILINNVNPPTRKNNIKQFLEITLQNTTHKFVSILKICILQKNNLQDIIKCFTDEFIHDIFCGLELDQRKYLEPESKIHLLTGLKNAGDTLSAQAAKKLDCVFKTTDVDAALYAIEIGCKTVLQTKALDANNNQTKNVVYYIFNPNPTEASDTDAEMPPVTAAANGASTSAAATSPKGPKGQKREREREFITKNQSYDDTVKVIFNKRGRLIEAHGPARAVARFVKDLKTIVEEAEEEEMKEDEEEDQGNKLARDENDSDDEIGGGGNKLAMKGIGRKLKRGGNISNEEHINIMIEYLYERSREGPRDYIRKLLISMDNYINGEIKPVSEIFTIDEKRVTHMKDYLDNVHILKYGYSTPLQYTVLRFLELSNVPFEGAPFTMERYATWIRENVEKYRKAEKAEKVEKEEREKSAEARLQKAKQAQAEAEAEREKRPLLVSNQPSKQLYKRESIYERESISESKGLRTPSRGGNQNNNTAIIDEYEKKLTSLYKKYIKLAESNKTEQELSKEFEKLDMGIQKLSAKIKKTMEKEIKK